MDALDIIESETRELIRHRGLQADLGGLDELVSEVVDDYDRRSVTGEVPPLGDPAGAARTVSAMIGGFGPLQQYFDDPEVEEIWLNSPAEVYCARGGRSELTTTVLTDTQVRDVVERMLASSGRRLDLSSPFVDALLPDGSRLHVVIPTVTKRHWAVNIRKFIARAHSLDDMVRLGSLSRQAASVLHAAVASGLNVVVSGATGAGKTTMLNALAGSIGPRERVVTIEEVFELDLPVRDVVALQCRAANLEGTGEIDMRRLVKESLRMRPTRLVVGEVREAEALDMLVSLNSGLPGMASIHANSARDAVTKLCTLPLLAGENVSSHFVVPTVASCIDLVVHLDLEHDGRRATREVVALTGRVESGIIETDTLFETVDGRLRRGRGYPPHEERFRRAGFDLVGLLDQDAA